MSDTDKLINKAAADVLTLARSVLIVKLRFMDMALSRLHPVPDDDATLATDGVRLVYGPRHVLRSFRFEPERPARDYLHAALHCIFSHMFVGTLADSRLWDLACDIAVESTINDLGLQDTASSRAAAQNSETEKLRAEIRMLTAEKIYHYYLGSGLPESEVTRLGELFRADDHAGWHRSAKNTGRGRDSDESNDAGRDRDSDEGKDADAQDDGPGDAVYTKPAPDVLPDELVEEWRNIADKVQDALETFFREQGDSAGTMMQNLKAVSREKYDYAGFLRKFAVYGEKIGVNDEEFDFIYYMYGLSLYGDMPLVEPLEYKEVKRIREFVIAVDTSGSTSGPLVQKFLQKTYNILKSTESYFSRVNIHIIQCDAAIREHVKITSEEEFDSYISGMKILGLGGTDFRPVFEFVDSLIEEHEFTDLKGLIYFTDGYGTFPARKPPYDTAFVFLDNEYNNPDVPPWAIRLVLQNEEIEDLQEMTL